jgi:NADH dehydrogenase [ubiquinone] 1 alpha subcomplex assembly factor 6
MVASDIGVALGLITALRSTSFRAMQGEISIPLDLTNKYSITMDTLYNAANAHNDESVDIDKSAQKAVRNASKELAEMASFHLHRARSKQSVVPKEARTCLLPAVCGLEYLDSLKKCNYDVFHPSLGEGRRLGLMMLLGRAWATGRI